MMPSSARSTFRGATAGAVAHASIRAGASTNDALRSPRRRRAPARRAGCRPGAIHSGGKWTEASGRSTRCTVGHVDVASPANPLVYSSSRADHWPTLLDLKSRSLPLTQLSMASELIYENHPLTWHASRTSSSHSEPPRVIETRWSASGRLSARSRQVASASQRGDLRTWVLR